MDNKETNIYEDAIMDCCTKHEVLKEFKQLMNRYIDEHNVIVNGKYRIVGLGADTSKARPKYLRFYASETENFPGIEFKNDIPIGILEKDEKTGVENFLCAEIVFTFHEDTSMWTGIIHLYSLANDDFNKIEKIVSVE